MTVNVVRVNTNCEWGIYTLSDPRTLRARYVGVTTRGEAERYRRHLSQARRGGSHLHNWIKSLLGLGLRPIYLALEYGHGVGWQERERFWISAHRKFCDLVNATDGGDGFLGYVPTIQHRAKISLAMIGNKRTLGFCPSLETRAKMRAAMTGKKRPPQSLEHRAKIGAAMRGRILTAEHRAKMSVVMTGRVLTPEHRAGISRSLLNHYKTNRREAEKEIVTE